MNNNIENYVANILEFCFKADIAVDVVANLTLRFPTIGFAYRLKTAKLNSISFLVVISYSITADSSFFNQTVLRFFYI